jgi:hypothetical protein
VRIVIEFFKQPGTEPGTLKLNYNLWPEMEPGEAEPTRAEMLLVLQKLVEQLGGLGPPQGH